MAAELDPRIVRVGIQINDQIKYYEGLAITATGTKYGNANQNECEVKIANLDKATRNYILTETSPFNLNKTPKKLIVEAGRVSYGTSRIFEGDIVVSGTPKNPLSGDKQKSSKSTGFDINPNKKESSSQSGQISQPPDITITLNALTANFEKGNIIAVSQPAKTKVSEIASQAAAQIGTTLDFQATDKYIANYSFSGGSLKQVEKIGELGHFNAYIDDKTLVVKDAGVALNNRVRILNLDTGMIGIPEINEKGIKVKFLLDNQTTLGSALQITSQLYPALNGTYVIYQLGFDIASRDTPFYWIASATRLE